MNKSKTQPPRVLDATFRDGGFYTDWYFPRVVVEQTVQALFRAGVDWIELGYRTPATDKAHGLYKYCTEHYLDFLPEPNATRYAFMVDLKDYVSNGAVDHSLLRSLISPSEESIFSMGRVACHARDISLIEDIIDFLRGKNYLTCVNLMGSSLLSEGEFLECMEYVRRADPDVFYFADSFGSMTPEHVGTKVEQIRSAYDGALGIHTHDNQGLAFANALQAIKEGVEYVDATLTGMGRGPGNLQLEQLMLWLADVFPERDFEPNELLRCIESFFSKKKREYGWGFNYVYMLSGLKNIHPSYTQKLSEGNKFSFKDISRMLEQIPATARQSYEDDKLTHVINANSQVYSSSTELPVFNDVSSGDGKCLIVARGGGSPHEVLEANRLGVSDLACAVQDYLRRSRIQVFECNQTFILEDHPGKIMCVLNRMRLQEIYSRPLLSDFSIVTAQTHFSLLAGKPEVSQYPCTLGPIKIAHGAVQIPEYEAGQYAIALAVALGFREILLAGFDGYAEDGHNNRMTQFFDQMANKVSGLSLTFVTPTHYQGVKKRSVYTY
jgi:4-hydroxy 2-oxovalerate aldolase